jgi:putative PIN family toxin of toxin-antitoxin system
MVMEIGSCYRSAGVYLAAGDSRCGSMLRRIARDRQYEFEPGVQVSCATQGMPEYGYTDITMNRIVLDTCVLVSAIKSRNGASFALVSRLPDPAFQICLSVAVYTEWQSVLARPEHLPAGTDAAMALGFVRYLASIAHLQDVHFLWRPFLRDPDDDMVLECAVASGAQTIVTHNLKDFRRAESLGVRAITPASFLKTLKGK